MQIKLILTSLLLAIAPICIGQEFQYDPLLDTSTTLLEKYNFKSQGEYIWHPGQLSAHLQRIRLIESNQRCVNVGYPGNFYKPVAKTYFLANINLPSEAVMEWKSTGRERLYVNGKEINSPVNSHELRSGKSIVQFKVETDSTLPAIKIALNGKPFLQEWQASIDSVNWKYAESSPVFGITGKEPLADPEIHVAIKPRSVLPVRNAIVNKEEILIRKNGYVLVDFFHLEVGQVSFLAKGEGNITVFVGETPEEALNENTVYFEQYPIESYSLSPENRLITLPERALRYIKILSTDDCELSSIQFTAKVWPVQFTMSFECSDERINNIWKASVAAIHANMHGFYLDGIKRDYLPWSMDGVMSTFAGDYLFGDEQVSRNNLSIALLPINPSKEDIGIPDYPLHALVGLNHNYQRFGDFNTILSYQDRIEQLLQLYETLQDERGFISANIGAGWGFVPSWATRQGPDRKGTPTYAQIMLYYNFLIGADFAEKWGNNKLSRHYRMKAEALKESIMQNFWSDDKGLFYNGFDRNGELDKGISHHAQYWAILAGLFPENRYDHLFGVLSKIPYYRDDVSYEKGYEFLAYSKARKVSEMWDFLLDVFGDWLKQGHTRFPENFSYKMSRNDQLVFYDRPFGLSLCHAANGVPGVIAVLNGIAGFSQSTVNLNHYTLQPDLMDLDWATIEFPVKEGNIRLKLLKNGKSEIEIPAGCKVDYLDKNNNKVTFSKSGVYSL